MSEIFIERTNASFIRVLSDDQGIVEDCYQYFRFEEPTFKPNKWNKSKWDGVVRMYNKASGALPYGLLQVVLEFCKTRGYTYDLDPRFKNDITNITRAEIIEWTEGLQLVNEEGEPLVPYDYQIEAVFYALRYNRMTILAATSAGKSLIMYLLVRYYDMLREAGEQDGRTLVVVPSIMLTNQMFSDFRIYSAKNGWDVNAKVHTIAEGSAKNSRRPVYVSTWQSIKDQEGEYFQQFSNILIDEAHGASAKCIKTICENATSAYQRIGMTGTLKNTELHPLMVQGNFGPIKRVVSTKQLQDAGRAAQTMITRMQLNYSTEDRKMVSEMTYQEEIEWLIGHPQRNRIIKTLAKTLKGNSLFLFDRKDKHQVMIMEQLAQEDLGNKKVFIINGDVDSDDRDAIKKIAETESDVVILASYGTMAVGVSIKQLHNLVFCHPTKSIIRVLQSIGRLLRLHKTKDVANIYDLFDNLEYRGRANKTLDHATERLGFYENEQHPVRLYQMEIAGEKVTTTQSVISLTT